MTAIEEKDEFYQQNLAAIDKTPKRDTYAKFGADNTNSENIMSRHGIGRQNGNEELFVESCTFMT